MICGKDFRNGSEKEFLISCTETINQVCNSSVLLSKSVLE